MISPRKLADRQHVRGSSLVALSSLAHFRFLKARGIEVIHILDANKTEPHPFTSAARIVEGALTYASDQGELIRKTR